MELVANKYQKPCNKFLYCLYLYQQPDNLSLCEEYIQQIIVL